MLFRRLCWAERTTVQYLCTNCEELTYQALTEDGPKILNCLGIMDKGFRFPDWTYEYVYCL